VILDDPAKPANSNLVLAVAYTQDEHIAGIRRWEAAQPIANGASLPFTLSVYSMGPEIVRVEVYGEARAKLE